MGYPGHIEGDLLVRHKRCKYGPPCEIGTAMLWTIFVVLCVLWLFGVVTSYTLGGFIHILLLVALGIIVVNFIQGRRRAV